MPYSDYDMQGDIRKAIKTTQKKKKKRKKKYSASNQGGGSIGGTA